MKDEAEAQDRINYEKPEIIDVSSVAPIHGSFCSAGDVQTDCTDGAMATPGQCNVGDGFTTLTIEQLHGF